MRFHKRFDRYVGGQIALLGSDAAPHGEAYLTRDNVIVTRQFNASGWPVQRISCGWFYVDDAKAEESAPSAKASDVEIELIAYVFDHGTGRWFETSRATVSEQKFVQLDMPTLIDAPVAASQLQSPDPVEVAVIARPAKRMLAGVVVSTPELPPGRYTFILGSDCSNTP